jgi:hypothetical protein
MKVVEWAWSDEPFGVIPIAGGPSDSNAIPIHGFAICFFGHKPVFHWMAKRPDSIYFFSCDASCEVESDHLFGLVADGKARLSSNFAGARPRWHRWKDYAV